MSLLDQNLETAIPQIVENILLDLHTATIGEVVEYSRTTQRAKVQISLKSKWIDEDEAVALPQLNDVLVASPGTGGLWLIGDIEVGSSVVLLFSERSIAAWKATGGVIDPGIAHMHDRSDAIALASVWSTIDTISPVASGTLSIRNATNTIKIEVATDGTITIENPAGSVVVGPSGYVTLNGGTRKAAGENHPTTITAVTDPTFFTWLGAVSTALSLTPPTSISGIISDGESTVRIP